MAVAEVKAVNIVGKLEMLNDVVIACGSSGLFQADNVSNFYSDNKSFVPLVDKNPYTELLAKFDEALSFSGISVKQVDTAEVNMTYDELHDYAEVVYDELMQLTGNKKTYLNEITDCKKAIEETGHFLGYNLEMSKISSCKYIKAIFGRLPKDGYKKLSMYEDNPYVLFIPCTSDDTHYWGVYISPVEHSSTVDRIFSGLFFEPVEILGLEGTPEEYYNILNERLTELEDKYNDACECEKAFILDNLEKITVARSKAYEMNTYFDIKNYAISYDGSFILAGWISAKSENEFKAKLADIKNIECTVSSVKGDKRISPPVKLKNGRFSRPFEFYVDMYGLPDYNEIDPTTFVAISYSLLFGIMFGDLGQGIVLSLVGLFMYHVMGMALGRILTRCGFFSAIFGVIYGSVFGFEHTLDPLFKSLGFAEKPIEVMNPQTTNIIIYSAVGIGAVMIVIAMLLNIYSSIKRHDIERLLFSPNGLAGFIFYVSLVAGLVSSFLFDNSIMSTPYVLCFIVLPLLLIFLQEPLGKLVEGKADWQPESWCGYMAQSFFELFETVLSYVTNTMSFLRVGAFVLVHAGMMMVVFTLADMTSGFAYLAIVILGNALVIALEGLLVGIQVLRLEFYEMFSRFYSGQGRAFSPITIKKSKKSR